MDREDFEGPYPVADNTCTIAHDLKRIADTLERLLKISEMSL